MRSFFHKTIPSLLRLSNADVDQPPQPPPRHRRSFPHQFSDVAGLRLIGSSVDIHHSPNVLEAVTVKYSGNSETPSDGGGGSGWTCELALCTESLGLESSSDRTRIDETDEGAESPAAADTTGRDEAARPRRREAGAGSGGAVSKSFPPILSTLRRSGRPRFDLRSVRRDGRLEIISVRNDRPEIIRSRRSDGCLVMHLDEDVPQQGDHCDDQDDL